MAEQGGLALVRQAWAALAGRDIGALTEYVSPDARWRAVEDGPWNCESRAAILNVLGRLASDGPFGQLEGAETIGDRVLVRFRPNPGGEPNDWPLEDGVRHLVVTVAGGRIVELKGCATQAGALTYATGRETPAPPA